MANVKGRNITVAIAATYSAAITGVTVSKANPGVATKTSHGLTDGAVGYFSGVSGMAQLENQACQVNNAAANTWEIEGLNTTNFATQTGTCSFTPVATWATLSEARSYSIGGGAADKLDATRLIDVAKVEEQGLLPASNVTLTVLAQETSSAAMVLIETAVQTQSAVIVRITLASGATRVFRGEPSLPGEDVQLGALGTGTMDLAVKGFVLRCAA